MGYLGMVLGALLVILATKLWQALFDLIWRPYIITKRFEKQGVRGPPYKFPLGAKQEIKDIQKGVETLVLDSRSHDITSKALPHYQAWSSQYGTTFLYWMGTKPTICLGEPEMVKQVLSSKFGFYAKPYPGANLMAMLGKGLVFTEGSDWARHRRVINPAFHIDKLKMLAKTMAECVLHTLSEWEKQGSDNKARRNHDQQLCEKDIRHVEQRCTEATTRGRGGRGGRGGSSHISNVRDTMRHSAPSNSRAMMVAPGIRSIHQAKHTPPSPCHTADVDGSDQAQLSPGTDLQVVVQTLGSTSMDIDSKVKGKRKVSSSSPPLLMSSLDQRPESSNDAHRRFVERVEQALCANKVCSKLQNDLDISDEDSGSEDSADERTLWDFQKRIQKGSQARKGVQLLSSVQKKKIQKKEKRKRADRREGILVPAPPAINVVTV